MVRKTLGRYCLICQFSSNLFGWLPGESKLNNGIVLRWKINQALGLWSSSCKNSSFRVISSSNGTFIIRNHTVMYEVPAWESATLKRYFYLCWILLITVYSPRPEPEAAISSKKQKIDVSKYLYYCKIREKVVTILKSDDRLGRETKVKTFSL